MECLTDYQIQKYLDRSLNSIEMALVRDHLLVCGACKKKHDKYQQVENVLRKPVYIDPPDIIERNVLKRFFPVLPTYSSIITLIAVSIIFLVSFIYIYFDFANNSIIRALQLTSNDTSNWIASAIRIISSIFSGVYAVFKAINSILNVIFNINVGVEMVASLFSMVILLALFLIYRFVSKKVRGQN